MAANWYYIIAGRNIAGPCSSAELKRLAAKGKLTPDDFVGKNRQVKLVKAGTIKGLFLASTK